MPGGFPHHSGRAFSSFGRKCITKQLLHQEVGGMAQVVRNSSHLDAPAQDTPVTWGGWCLTEVVPWVRGGAEKVWKCRKDPCDFLKVNEPQKS
jgi:hypothetical protein